MVKRIPAVAGQFYQASHSALEHEVEQLVVKEATRESVIGAVSPHAGLIYSGSVAGSVYSKIKFPDTFILLGPNHTGLGAPFSIMAEGEWEIPTNTFTIDHSLASRILDSNNIIQEESSAHLYEHSLEVQLPFIAYFSKNVQIVPITVMNATLDECKLVGESLAGVIKESEKCIVIIASSDMSHYISDKEARFKDNLAIGTILSLNPQGLYDIIKKENITMCGYIPAAIMLYAAVSLGAVSAELIKYATSAETSGDYDHVVGYAGIIVK